MLFVAGGAAAAPPKPSKTKERESIARFHSLAASQNVETEQNCSAPTSARFSKVEVFNMQIIGGNRHGRGSRARSCKHNKCSKVCSLAMRCDVQKQGNMINLNFGAHLN